MSTLQSKGSGLFPDQERADIKTLQEKVCTDIKNAYDVHVGSKVTQVSHRVILTIGRSRAGKSTFKKMLVDPTQITQQIEVAADRGGPSLTSMVINDSNIVLDFIDTPGILERVNRFNRAGKRDDDVIFDMIADCVKMEMTKIHLFCFVAPFSAFYNDDPGDDCAALEKLIEYFGRDITNNSCLIVTRCESRSSQELEELKALINDESCFRSMANFFKKGIFYSGALNGEDWNKEPRNLYDQFENICNYRKCLIDLFSSSIQPYEVRKSALSDEQQGRRNFQKTINTVRTKLTYYLQWLGIIVIIYVAVRMLFNS